MFEKFYNRIILSSLVFGIIIGTIVFVSIFGVSILNPKNIDWYINLSGDPGQHILGWLAYLRSDYFFPIGLTDYLLYPNKYSIMYTDSIPLFSFIFKVLHSITGGGDFQYFGLYGLFNFIMQVTLSIIIIRKFTDNIIIHICGSVLVLFSPILYLRIFMHHSLSSHWILLLSIAYCIYNYKKNNLKKDILFFSGLFFIIPGIHFYFFPMVFGICFIYVLYKYITFKDLKYIFVCFFAILLTVLSLYIFGAFYGLNKSGSVGYYGANLNAFFNSFGYSLFFKELNTLDAGQIDGFAYLGLGIFLLMLIFILLFLYYIIKDRHHIKLDRKAFIITFIFTIFIILISTGGRISLGNKLFLLIDMPEIFYTFRASGRFIWVPVYIMIFFLIYFFATFVPKKFIWSIIIVLILQIIDISPIIESNKQRISLANSKDKIYLYNKNECKELTDSFKYAYLYIGEDDYIKYYDDIYRFLKCNLPVNDFYFARRPDINIKENNNKLFMDIYSGKILDNILILTDNKSILLPCDFNKYDLGENGKYILSNKKISFLKELEEKRTYMKLSDKILPDNDINFLYSWAASEKTHRWSLKQESIMFLPLEKKDYIVNIKLRPYINSILKEQFVEFKIKNKILLKEKMVDDYKVYRFRVDSEDIENNGLFLTIKLEKSVSSPYDIGINDNRKLGVAFRELYIEE